MPLARMAYIISILGANLTEYATDINIAREGLEWNQYMQLPKGPKVSNSQTLGNAKLIYNEREVRLLEKHKKTWNKA